MEQDVTMQNSFFMLTNIHEQNKHHASIYTMTRAYGKASEKNE